MEENRDNYTVIPGWTKRLGLSLVEKVVYCVIYGFSQDEDSTFHGSRSYLASICECSVDTIDRALKKLLELGLISKQDKFQGGVKFCEYSVAATSRNLQGVAANCPEGGRKMRHNNEVDKSTSNSNNIEIATRTHAREEKKKFDFYASLLDLGISEQAASDWMLVRKNAKATNTETAFNALHNQIDKICRRYGVTPDQVARFAASHDWKGINADWEAVKNIKKDADHSADNDEDAGLPF